MTLTAQFTRYRATALDPTDLRPIPSTKWWARMVADTAESIEWAVNNDDLAAAKRRVDMAQRCLDSLRSTLESLDTCGCGNLTCEKGCFT